MNESAHPSNKTTTSRAISFLNGFDCAHLHDWRNEIEKISSIQCLVKTELDLLTGHISCT